jgi:hypothetical protein
MPVTLGLRPKLQFDVEGTSPEICRQIRDAQSIYPVTALDHYLVITIPQERRHYWSPQLQIELEDNGNGTVHVSGLITPMPAVWTLFAGIYTTILVMGFFGLMFGLAQLQLDITPAWGMWSLPLSAGLIGLVYAAAMIGQSIGREQTRELTAFLDQCLSAACPQAGHSTASAHHPGDETH